MEAHVARVDGLAPNTAARADIPGSPLWATSRKRPALGNRVFERFVSDGAVDGSTGLGLAIVRGLVEAHAGRIWLEEPDPGEGGRFAFTLPIATKDDRSDTRDGRP